MHRGELKPCPFCGSENICHSAWDIQCYGCNASIPGDPNISADAWNRRAALSAALEAEQPVAVRKLDEAPDEFNDDGSPTYETVTARIRSSLSQENAGVGSATVSTGTGGGE